MTAGIKRVAEEAGVSMATVSRVLSGASVRPASRAKVEAALARLDYLPNLYARRLRSAAPSLIGVVVPDIGSSFFRDVVRALESHARRERLRLVLCSSDEDPVRQAEQIAMLHQERVSGIVLAPVLGTPAPKVSLPLVLFDRHEGEAPHDLVTLDNEGGAAALVDALSGDGCRRILGLFGPRGSTAAERERGFARRLETRGLTGGAARVTPDTVANEIAVAGADAVVCGDAQLLLEAAAAIRDMAKPPRLAGFDRVEWMRLLPPAMPILVQPVDEIAHAALALLAARMDGADHGSEVLRFTGRMERT